MAIKFSENNENSHKETLGVYLKDCRKSQGISLQEVHNKTMIKLHFLDAIEDDSLDTLIDIRFARMHILNFARYIGADIDITMKLYKKQYERKDIPNLPIKKRKEDYGTKVFIPRVFFKIFALLAIIVVLFAVGLNLHNKGVLHRNIFHDNGDLKGITVSDTLNGSNEFEQSNIFSYKKEDFYLQYILKGKDVPWHVYPRYVKNQ